MLPAEAFVKRWEIRLSDWRHQAMQSAGYELRMPVPSYFISQVSRGGAGLPVAPKRDVI